MAITSLTNPKAGRPGLLAYINDFQSDQPNHWRNITSRFIGTKSIYEEVAALSGLDTAREYSDGARIAMDEMSTPFTKTYHPKIYALGVSWTKLAAYTDQYGILKNNKKWLAQSLYHARENMVAALIDQSTSASYTWLDGVALSSASHPYVGGATFSNQSTAATLSYASLEQMLVDVTGHKQYRGQPWIVSGAFNLIVPRQLGPRARRILQTPQVAGTADNDKNIVAGEIRYTPGNPYLTGTTRYALIPAAEKDNPLFILEGMPMGMEENFNVDNDLKYELMVYRSESANAFLAAGTQFNEGA